MVELAHFFVGWDFLDIEMTWASFKGIFFHAISLVKSKEFSRLSCTKQNANGVSGNENKTASRTQSHGGGWLPLIFRFQVGDFQVPSGGFFTGICFDPSASMPPIAAGGVGHGGERIW